MEAAYYLERIAEFFPEALGRAAPGKKWCGVTPPLNESQRVDESIARLEKDFAETEIVVAGKNVKALEYARELAGVGAAEEDDDAWPMAGGVDAGQSARGGAGRDRQERVDAVSGRAPTSTPTASATSRFVTTWSTSTASREVTAYSLLSGRGPGMEVRPAIASRRRPARFLRQDAGFRHTPTCAAHRDYHPRATAVQFDFRGVVLFEHPNRQNAVDGGNAGLFRRFAQCRCFAPVHRGTLVDRRQHVYLRGDAGPHRRRYLYAVLPRRADRRDENGDGISARSAGSGR